MLKIPTLNIAKGVNIPLAGLGTWQYVGKSGKLKPEWGCLSRFQWACLHKHPIVHVVVVVVIKVVCMVVVVVVEGGYVVLAGGKRTRTYPPLMNDYTGGDRYNDTVAEHASALALKLGYVTMLHTVMHMC